jgi:hypothetical protein
MSSFGRESVTMALTSYCLLTKVISCLRVLMAGKWSSLKYYRSSVSICERE